MTKILTGVKLTVREQKFVDAYIADPKKNQANAAAAAGYSIRTGAKIAWELMKRPRVKAAIADALKAQQLRTLITADQVLLDMQRIGDKAELAGEFTPALQSRVWIGKHFKLFTDQLEVIDTTPRADRLRAARERKKQAGE